MGVVIVVRVVLALVFAGAALAKVSDRGATRQAAAALGVPAAWSGVAGAVLPWVELAVAVTLLPGTTARPGAAVGAALTAAFTVVLAINLRKGNRPACNCFGGMSAEPISGRSILRNLALLMGFLVVVIAPAEAGAAPAIADFALSHGSARTIIVTLLSIIAGEALCILRLLVRPRPMTSTPLEVPTGLPIGTPAPDFVLPDLSGREHRLADLLEPDRPLLLVLVDPRCQPCQALLPEVADWRSTWEAALAVAVVSRGSVEENEVKIGELVLEPVLLQEADELATAFAAPATPSAVLISPSGRVLASAAGAHSIRHMVGTAVSNAEASGAAVQTLPPGADAPLFALPSMRGGEEITLLEERGRLTIVLFWSPTCGFCKAMARELRGWEAQVDREHGPRLIVVSDGSPTEADAPFRLVGVDSGALLRRAYGVTGTPMAVLVDAEARIASEVVVGAEATMALARRAESLASVADRLTGQSQRIPVVADQS